MVTGKSKRSNQAGFTLIEIAIVLVIIGLLIGGVLKGQELIINARIKSLANDMRSVQAMFFAYQDRYRALPGDDSQTAMRFPASGADPAATNGNANGIIDGAKFSDASTEAKAFWQHVRRANLATGSAAAPDTAAAEYLPPHGFSGFIGVSSTMNINGLPGSASVCANNIPGQHAMTLVAAIDDGQADAGTVRVRANITTGTTTNTTVDAVATATVQASPNTLYTVCWGF
jgi:prepilin-type N-terminal cleavage/methylation domain-containing protein